MTTEQPPVGLRRAVAVVALLNLAYFGIEFSVALAIGSVSLFADSIDFLEDTATNLLILLALGWSARKRSVVGMLLAAILLAPGIATIWTAWQKFNLPVPPAIAIIAAGLITAATFSPWPDLIVGLCIFLINLDAAREVFVAARGENVPARA